MLILLLIIGSFIVGGSFGAFLMTIFIGGARQGERQDYIAGLMDGYKQVKKELNQATDNDNGFITTEEQREKPLLDKC